MDGILIINTDRGVQSGPSGYARLIDFLGEVRLAQARRRDPRTLIPRVLTRIARLSATTRWYRLGSLSAEVRAIREIWKRTPRLVHVLWGDQDWGYIDRFLPNTTAFVVSVHNPPELLHENFARTKALERVDRFILMSPDQAAYFIRQGVPPQKCVFIPHGIDTSAFSPVPKHGGTRGEAVHVLHVGNYLRNFEHLSALTREFENGPFRFQIVCAPEVRSGYRFGTNVEWHHGITDAALIDLYRRCDVLLMTATGATANNALLEGIACGLPVVAQDVGGVGAYLDPSCAILTAAENWHPLRDALLSLAGDPERMAAMGMAARRQAERFAWSEIAERTMGVYGDAIRERRAA